MNRKIKKARGVKAQQLKSAKKTISAKKSLLTDDTLASLDWNELFAKVKECPLCDLAKTHTNIVFGIGNKKAEVMLIGEAPGATEDLKGEPFVGRAGKLLDVMLKSIGLDRKAVYITNILKCRPPNNRTPLPYEIQICMPYLKRQIELVNPKVIIAVGRTAAHALLNNDLSMDELRSGNYSYGPQKIPLFVTYHPAYLLRLPHEKTKANQDFLRIKKFLAK